jgi:hypothetical protein
MKNISRFAKLDPAHILDGLFVPKVLQGQALFGVEGQFDNGVVRFEGVQLGVEHQSILLAVAARTGRQGAAKGILARGTADDLMARQWSMLEATGPLAEEDVSLVECSAYSLLMDAGMGDSASDYQNLLRLLVHLGSVVMYRSRTAKGHTKGGTTHLLSFQHEDDRLAVTLNYRMTHAIFGGQNVRVNLHERHSLRSPVAKILHTWLSSYVREGYSLMAGQGAMLDTLARHVWGKRPASDVTIRKRRAMLREALEQIADARGLDGERAWSFAIEGQKVQVHRSKPVEIIGADMSPGDVAERMTYDPADPDNDVVW